MRAAGGRSFFRCAKETETRCTRFLLGCFKTPGAQVEWEKTNSANLHYPFHQRNPSFAKFGKEARTDVPKNLSRCRCRDVGLRLLRLRKIPSRRRSKDCQNGHQDRGIVGAFRGRSASVLETDRRAEQVEVRAEEQRFHLQVGPAPYALRRDFFLLLARCATWRLCFRTSARWNRNLLPARK